MTNNMAANYPTSALESEVYWSLKSEVLIELRDLLVEKLDVDKIISYLRSKRVLDRVDSDDIQAAGTPTKRREKFLDILSDKGPDSFDHFCHAVRERSIGQGYLLDIILTTFDRKKQERIPKEPLPSEDPKLVVVVTGMTPNAYQVDLNNLPRPGDPGAPIPPDEMNAAIGHPPAYPTNPTPNSPPPSYASELPPPYSEY